MAKKLTQQMMEQYVQTKLQGYSVVSAPTPPKANIADNRRAVKSKTLVTPDRTALKKKFKKDALAAKADKAVASKTTPARAAKGRSKTDKAPTGVNKVIWVRKSKTTPSGRIVPAKAVVFSTQTGKPTAMQG